MKPHILSLILSLSISMGVASCNAPAEPKTISCSQIDTTIPCLLKLGQTTLDETIDDFSWASGAAELAIAYDVSGQSEQAETLIGKAIARAKTIEDLSKRRNALGEILTALAALSKSNKALTWLEDITPLTVDFPEAAKADIAGKTIIVRAIHAGPKTAFTEALNMAEDTDAQAYAKAITLRKHANIFAKSGDLKAAREAVDSVTMSIDYYQSMVRADVAHHAYKAGDSDFAITLLNEADPIARSLENGYFSGAALRDIGYSYQQMGKLEKAQVYFTEALTATAIADKQNEKARSTSRIATRLADAKLLSQTPSVLKQAEAFAEDIQAGRMKSYSYYEIAGAAAMAGQFGLAEDWLNEVPDIPMGSTSSIKEAAKRDLAWGLTRHGNVDKAMEVVRSINADREKIHAISRMIRVLNNPDMEALPRYL